MTYRYGTYIVHKLQIYAILYCLRFSFVYIYKYLL